MGAAEPRRRLFFALWPNEALRESIVTAAVAAARRTGLGGRPTPAGKLHLTLQFLGDVDPAAERQVQSAAQAVRCAPFELVLDEAGSFARSRVAWIGASQPPPGLITLWSALREGLGPIGEEHNRRALAPHVTCYRDVDRPLRTLPIDPIRWPVHEFVLVHSALGAGGQYHVVSHWPLQTGST